MEDVRTRTSELDKEQCDQILVSKLTPNFPVLAQIVTKVAFYYIVTYFKIAQKVSKYLGHVDEKICCKELSKIAQFSHTEKEAICVGVLCTLISMPLECVLIKYSEGISSQKKEAL